MERWMDDVRALLAALVGAALRDDAASAPYLDEARHLHGAMPGYADLTPGRLDGLWTQAVHRAEAPAAQEDERRVSLTLPAGCPFAPEDIGSSFDAEALATRIRESAGTG